MASRLLLLSACALGALGAACLLQNRAAAAEGPTLPFSTGLAADDEFLPVDEAFRLSASATAPDRIEVHWIIAKGYYLYRNKLKFVLPAGEQAQAALGPPGLPNGDMKTDEFFGTQQVYHNAVIAQLPVARAASGPITLPLKVSYQGCADAGLCYPPETRTLTVDMPAASARSLASLPAGAVAGGADGAPYVSEQDKLTALLLGSGLAMVLLKFFGIGLLLSLTPCMWPMVPILSGIITSQGSSVTTSRAFLLSLTYVLGMSLTYTAAGAAFAAAGQQAQAIFQQAWIIVLFSGLFVALALSMFGLFTVQMPAAIQTRLAQTSNQQRAGTFGGVAVMGALSALIVTTCVAPALIAALTVIGQRGDIARGAGALFAMSFGMGAPLLLVGTSAGRLLPRAGPWMDMVKQLFGVMMLGVAVWMIERIVPARVTLVLWAVPVLAGAWVLARMGARSVVGRWTGRILGAAAALYAALLLTGALRGAADPLHPLQVAAKEFELPFQRIKSLADLQAAVATAKAGQRAVLLDFYADWCVSCKEMEKYSFPDPAVRAALGNALLLRADVTANNDEDKALLKHFGIFGPPTIAFYGADGAERSQFRVVGYMKAAEFAAVARQALADPAQAIATHPSSP